MACHAKNKGEAGLSLPHLYPLELERVNRLDNAVRKGHISVAVSPNFDCESLLKSLPIMITVDPEQLSDISLFLNLLIELVGIIYHNIIMVYY